MKKLSKSQQEVVDLMKKGYQLGYTKGWKGPDSVWLQEGKVGWGGKTVKVNAKTFKAMWEAKMFKDSPDQPRGVMMQAYILADEVMNEPAKTE